MLLKDRFQAFVKSRKHRDLAGKEGIRTLEQSKACSAEHDPAKHEVRVHWHFPAFLIALLAERVDRQKRGARGGRRVLGTLVRCVAACTCKRLAESRDINLVMHIICHAAAAEKQSASHRLAAEGSAIVNGFTGDRNVGDHPLGCAAEQANSIPDRNLRERFERAIRVDERRMQQDTRLGGGAHRDNAEF